MKLPHCNDLFAKFFDPWYSQEDRERRKGGVIVRPDMWTNRGMTVTTTGDPVISNQISAMLDAARSDFQSYLKVKEPIDRSWITAFDKYYDRKRISDVIKEAKPDDFSNNYLVICCEFGALLGHVMIQEKPRLSWFRDWPYWESAIFDPQSGTMVPTFHWAIKKMSEYGVDDEVVGKLDACLQLMDNPE